MSTPLKYAPEKGPAFVSLCGGERQTRHQTGVSWWVAGWVCPLRAGTGPKRHEFASLGGFGSYGEPILATRCRSGGLMEQQWRLPAFFLHQSQIGGFEPGEATRSGPKHPNRPPYFPPSMPGFTFPGQEPTEPGAENSIHSQFPPSMLVCLFGTPLPTPHRSGREDRAAAHSPGRQARTAGLDVADRSPPSRAVEGGSWWPPLSLRQYRRTRARARPPRSNSHCPKSLRA